MPTSYPAQQCSPAPVTPPEHRPKVAPSNAAEHHLAEYPLVFVCSSLTTEVNLELEAQLLLQQVRRFVVDNWPTSWGEKDLKQICIVTPSQAQVYL